MSYTDNPLRDYDNYETEQAQELARLPKCSECFEPIQDDFAYYINDEWICEKCLNDNYRKSVEPEY